MVSETGQVFALAAGKAAGRPVAPGALCTMPTDVGTDVRDWPAARREAVLTALMSAAPNTIVVDIDMEAHGAGAPAGRAPQLGAQEPSAHRVPPG